MKASTVKALQEFEKRFIDAFDSNGSFDESKGMSQRQGSVWADFGSLNDELKLAYEYGETRQYINEMFFRIEPHIKDARAFWYIASFIWVEFGYSDSRWEEAWHRYDRWALHINKRTYWMSFWGDVDGGEHAQTWLKNRSAKHEITLYRGFSVKDGQRIRGADKKGEVGYDRQEAGAGYSYTLSKQAAIQITNAFANDVIIKKNKSEEYGESTVDSIRKSFLIAGKMERDMAQAAFFGTYKVNKTDIVGLMLSVRGEQEVICKKAKLHRYEVITAETALTGLIIDKLRRSVDGKVFYGREEERLWKRTRKAVKMAMDSLGFIGATRLSTSKAGMNELLSVVGITTGDFQVSANGHMTVMHSSS